MPHLKEIFVKNAGHEEAYYEDFNVSFTNGDGTPGHTALNLKNGGGKTTLMELFFSIILPDRRKLSTKQRKFEDNFKREGLSFIISKWSRKESKQLPGTNSNIDFYIGACVQNVQNDLKIRHFSFRANEEFDLSHFKTSGFKQMEEFSKWFQAQKGAYPLNELRFFENRTQWKNHLAELGFVIEHFDLMSKMNRQEGNVETILAFENDGDFAAKVLEMITDDNSSIYTEIKDVFDGLTKLPQKKDEIEALSHVINKLRDSADYVDGYATVCRDLENIRSERQEFLKKVVATIARTLQDYQASKNSLDHIEKELQDARSDLDRAKKHRHFLDYTDKKKRSEYARQRRTRLERAMSCLELLRNRIEVAPLVQKLLSYENELAEIRQRDTSAPEETKDQACRLGTALRSWLRRDINELDKKLKDQKGNWETIEARIKGNQAEWEENIRLESEQETNRKNFRSWLQDFDKKKEEVCAGKDARERRGEVAREVEKVESELQSLDNERENNRKRQTELYEQKSSLQQQISQTDHRIQNDEAMLEEYDKKASKLKNNRLLKEVLESDEIGDLYSGGILEAIDAQSWDLPIRETDEEIRHLEYLLNRIEENDYIPQSEDVDKSLEVLRERGYTVYLMSHYLRNSGYSTERIRELIRKDPGAYGGLVVPSSQAFDDLANENLNRVINGPVSITSIAGEISQPCQRDDIHVFMPEHNLWYDMEECEQKSRKFRERVESLNKKLKDYEERKKQLESLKTDIVEFCKQYPEGHREAVEKQLGENRAARKKLDRDFNDAMERIESIQSRMGEIEAEQETKRQDAKRLNRELDRIDDFIKEDVEQYDLTKKRLDEIEANLQSIFKKKTELTGEYEQLEADRKAVQAEISRVENQIQKLQRYLKTIKYPVQEEASQPEEIDEFDRSYMHYESLARELDNIENLENVKQKEIYKYEGRIEEIKNSLDAMGQETVQWLYSNTQKIPKLARQSDSPVRENTRAKINSFRESIYNCKHEESRLTKELNKMVPPAEDHEIQYDPGRDKELVDARIAELEQDIQGKKEEKNRLVSEKRELKDKSKHYGYSIDYYVAPDSVSVSDILDHFNLAEIDICEVQLFEDNEACFKNKRNLEQREGEAKDKKQHYEKILSDTGAEIERTIHESELKKRQIGQRMIGIDLTRVGPEDLRGNIRELRDIHESEGFKIQKLYDDHKKIIQYAFTSCKDLLKKFSEISSQSKIPENIPEPWSKWSRKPFFDVKFNRNDERLTQTIENILNFHYQRGSPPESYKSLLKQVVYRYLQEDPDYRVRAYKIKEWPDGTRYPISAYGGFSGGQKVCAAIIFYIALSNVLRPSNRQGSILFLDNPFAKCNDADYIQLQFDVAKLYEVQLV